MKFLVDVNLSKSKKFIKEHPNSNLHNVKDEIDGKVTDKRLIKIAKNRGYGIYTQDKRCALDALTRGVVVWYKDQKTKERYKMKMQRLKFLKSEKNA